MESHSVPLAVHPTIGNTGIIRIELESLTFQISTELPVPQQGGNQHAVEGSQHLKVEHSLPLLHDNIWSVDLRGQFH